MADEKQPELVKDGKAEKAAKEESKRYFIVNPAGAVHEVTREHAAELLKQVGYRKATPAEVAAYSKTPIQRADKPIAKPFTSDPDAE